MLTRKSDHLLNYQQAIKNAIEQFNNKESKIQEEMDIIKKSIQITEK